MDPEDKAMDTRVREFLGDWDAPTDEQGRLLDSWSPTRNPELAGRFKKLVEDFTGRRLDAPDDDPRAIVQVGLNEIGKRTGYSRT